MLSRQVAQVRFNRWSRSWIPHATTKSLQPKIPHAATINETQLSQIIHIYIINIFLKVKGNQTAELQNIRPQRTYIQVQEAPVSTNELIYENRNRLTDIESNTIGVAKGEQGSGWGDEGGTGSLRLVDANCYI